MPYFLVATSKAQPENVFLGLRTIVASNVNEHCCRCQQWLGSRTDHSVSYDTDYYQQDDAKAKKNLQRQKCISLPSTILLFTRFVFYQLVRSRFLLSKKKGILHLEKQPPNSRSLGTSLPKTFFAAFKLLPASLLKCKTLLIVNKMCMYVRIVCSVVPVPDSVPEYKVETLPEHRAQLLG